MAIDLRVHRSRIGACVAIASAICGCGTTTPISNDNDSDGAAAGAGGGVAVDGGAGNTSADNDPVTCLEAAQVKSYVGCDYWPTVTTNPVWSDFDFAVVVANAQEVSADVVIERGGVKIAEGQVPSNGLEKFYLPWVKELKGPDYDMCVRVPELEASLRVKDGAYHLTSSVPVTVYQFSALQYQGAGGPPGKSWSACPGNQFCSEAGTAYGCYSYTNDASLLLPSTALTENYRVTTMTGSSLNGTPSYVALTGIQESGTKVTVQLSAGGETFAGADLPEKSHGGVFDFLLQRGEVVELVGKPNADLAGTLIQSSAPIQVIAGMPCVNVPFEQMACDHIEETVFPAETLGRHYFVVPPTGPFGASAGHVVRLVGNVNGTNLTYPNGAPPNAPTSIHAGQVVHLGIVEAAFEISGDHEFAVMSFQLGATLVDPASVAPYQKGDPAQSNVVAVEQYRRKYVFLAPDDYDVSYVDIVMPDAANVILDGAAVSGGQQPIGGGFSVARVPLGPGMAGAHLLIAEKPVGIQVIGYGSFTSYQYPGGLNLAHIAPPPPLIK